MINDNEDVDYHCVPITTPRLRRQDDTKTSLREKIVSVT